MAILYILVIFITFKMCHLFPVLSKLTGCCDELLLEAWKGWKTAAGFVVVESENMTQNPSLWVEKWDGGSAAEEEAWSNMGEQQRRRRRREEEVAVFGKVSWLGQAEAVDGDDDGGAVADDGKDGDDGGDAPVAPRCHTACSQGTRTQSEAPHQPLSVRAWASEWPGSAETGSAAAVEHLLHLQLWFLHLNTLPRQHSLPWRSHFHQNSLYHRRSVCGLQVGERLFLWMTLSQQ